VKLICFLNVKTFFISSNKRIRSWCFIRSI